MSAEELIEKIRGAFKHTKPPGNPIRDTGDVDGVDSVDLLNGFPPGAFWELIDQQVIDYNCHSLPFFNEMAYVYYLPSFLIRSLSNGEVYEFTFYSLTPVSVDLDLETKKKLLTESQLDCVRQFLCEAKTTKGFEITKEMHYFWGI